MLRTFLWLLRPSRCGRRRANRFLSFGLEQLERRIVPTNVLTYHNDIGSNGLNASETVLTPTNVVVNSFGKLHTVAVDGQVYAQPLVETAVTIAAGANTSPGATGLHDVVFVATEHDSLYAIDASANSGAVLWKRSFLDLNVAANNTLSATAISSVPNGDTGTGDITVEVGITGTPVIDASTGTLYVVAKTKETIGGADHYVQRLHAINITDGIDRTTPYLIGDTSFGNTNSTAIYVYGSGDGSVADPYNGTNKQVVQFNALREHQRGALSLVNNTLYVQWASHGDNGPYHGWVAKWDVSNLNTSGFSLTGVLNTSPNNGLSGIWQGGGRLVFEPNGSAFYFETGNGSGGAPTLNGSGFPTNANYNEALIKVVADATTGPTHQNANGWGLKVSDYFIPFNVNALDNADSDFGSGAPILLPDSAGIAGHPHLMVAGGKEGKLYLIDRDHLGHFDPNNDHVLNAVPDGSGHNTPPGAISGQLNTNAYFNGKLYALSGYGGSGHEFTINANGTLTDVSQTAIGSFGYLPGSPSISANGTTKGIVWMLDRNANKLRAYDAASLATELWNSGQKIGGSDNLGAVVKFAVPTVANGQVYVGTSNSLVVYGLVQPPSSAPNAPMLSASTLSGSAINLSWTDSSIAPNTADSYVIEKSTDGVHFNSVATSPAGSTSIAIGGLLPLTHYDFRIHGTNSFGDSAASNVADATTTDQVALLDFSGGFAGSTGLTLNGSSVLSGSRLELTDQNLWEGGSTFSSDRVDVTGFHSEFTFQIAAGDDIADGFTFTIQGASSTVVGNAGGDLAFAGLGQSVGIKFDLYNNAGEGTSSTGLFLNGVEPFNDGSIDLLPASLNLHSGHIFQAILNYDGTTLAVTLIDTQTNASATQNYTVDVPSIVGDNSAFVGFTAATGGLGAVQDILTWTYSPTATTSPNQPSGLGATPASADSIRLSWTNNATNQLGYHLDRATNSDFTENLITQTLPSNPATFTDTTTGLAPGSTFFYRLRAHNSVGDSDNSNTAEVSIPVAPPKPTNQQVTAVTDTEIDLRWQDNAGHHADGYYIRRAVNHGEFFTVATLPPTSRTAPSTYEWSDTDILPGNFFEYHILAFNVSGNNDFAGTNATTLTDPPISVTATHGPGVISLSWTASTGAVTFNVYRGTTPNGEDETPIATGLTSTSYSDANVTIGQTYYYKVTAINANADRKPVLSAESDFSAEASAIPSPAAPINLQAFAPVNFGEPQVTLTWTAVGGATSYNVYRSLSANGKGAVPLVTGLTNSNYLDNTIESFGTPYFYKVTAVANGSESPRSSEASAIPLIELHINFTSTTGDATPNYLNDVGLQFGFNGNWLKFGWNTHQIANGFDRDASNSPDERHDSFHSMSNTSGAIYWVIDLPNGNYSVHVIAGDPADTASSYKINVGTSSSGGTTVINGHATAAKRWLEGTTTVTVNNGSLVVNNASGSTNNKLDSIDITALTPTISKVSPTTGKPGNTITLTGKNFTGATAVMFNGLPATTFHVSSSTRITAVVPTGAITGKISVTTPGGTATSSSDFNVAPRITSFTPTGAPQDRIVITGANFTGATAVKLNGLKASFTVDSPTQITIIVPNNSTSGFIAVTTIAGTATSATKFVVAPRITGFTPTSAVVGKSVLITGANFTGATAVRFNGQAANFTVLSTTLIRAIVPTGATTGPLTITTSAGTAQSLSNFVLA